MRHQQERKPHGQEGGKTPFAPAGYAPRPEEEHNVEEHHQHSAPQPHFLNDDGIDKVGKRLTQEIALHGVSGHFSHHITRGYGNIGMGTLGVFVKVERVGRNDVAAVAVDTLFPGVHTVKPRHIVDATVLVLRQVEQRKQAKHGQNAAHAHQFAQLQVGHAPYPHHDEGHAEQQDCRRKVFGQDKHIEGQGDNQNIFKGLAVGPFFTLHASQNQGFGNDYDALGQL